MTTVNQNSSLFLAAVPVHWVGGLTSTLSTTVGGERRTGYNVLVSSQKVHSMATDHQTWKERPGRAGGRGVVWGGSRGGSRVLWTFLKDKDILANLLGQAGTGREATQGSPCALTLSPGLAWNSHLAQAVGSVAPRESALCCVLLQPERLVRPHTPSPSSLPKDL